MQQYRPSGFKLLPDVVKNLLIINILAFLATYVLAGTFGINLIDFFGLHWIGAEKFEPYQLVTYMFMHGGPSHIFFNMFAVWMFGSALENYWGPKRFLTYYLITGFGAAFIHYAIAYFLDLQPVIELLNGFINAPSAETLDHIRANHSFEWGSQQIVDLYKKNVSNISAVINGSATPVQLDAVRDFMIAYKADFLNQPNVVGASGSLFGLLLAFGMLFPNARLFMIFIPFPIKAKYFVLGYGLLELVQGISRNPNDNVAHFAHLGGMLFGYILIKLWSKNQYRQF